MTRLTICQKEHKKTALWALAEKEFRDPRAQAALIICQELERRGMLIPQEWQKNTYDSNNTSLENVEGP